MIIRLHRGAIEDLANATSAPGEAVWEEGEFESALRAALDRLARFPHLGPPHPIHTGIRVLALPRFPFIVPYRIDGAVLTVLAIAHTSRRPDYWDRRR